MTDARTFIEEGVKAGVPYAVRKEGYLQYVARRLFVSGQVGLREAIKMEEGEAATLEKYGIDIPPESDFEEVKASTDGDYIFEGHAEDAE